MSGFLNIIKKAEILIGTVLITFIVLLVFIAALVRWIGFPIAWSIDAAQLLFGWVVFLGADIALKNDSHIGVDMLVNRLSIKTRRIIKIVNLLCIQAFLTIIIYHGVNLSIDNYERLFNTLRLSYSYATISVPVGCTLMFLTNCEKILKVIKEASQKQSLNEVKHEEGEVRSW
ncbi:TRAP transporter small permease [Alkaliphilus crotonatoxidans]